MLHVCHAMGCSARVPARRIMCISHWKLLPVPLQKRVWAAYVSGQEERKDPSPEYLAAAREAVRFVQNVEAGDARGAADGLVLLRTGTEERVEKMFDEREEN